MALKWSFIRMNSANVVCHIILLCKSLATVMALKWSFIGMNIANVAYHCILFHKSLVTVMALKSMNSANVACHGTLLCKSLAIVMALKRSFIRMDKSVRRHMRLMIALDITVNSCDMVSLSNLLTK